jgi:hypothetical protein
MPCLGEKVLPTCFIDRAPHGYPRDALGRTTSLIATRWYMEEHVDDAQGFIHVWAASECVTPYFLFVVVFWSWGMKVSSELCDCSSAADEGCEMRWFLGSPSALYTLLESYPFTSCDHYPLHLYPSLSQLAALHIQDLDHLLIWVIVECATQVRITAPPEISVFR